MTWIKRISSYVSILAVLTCLTFAQVCAADVISCQSIFNESDALANLESFLNDSRGNPGHHSLLKSSDGSMTLQIGILDRVNEPEKTKKFLKLAMSAVMSGKIQKIDSGLVQGPKVLSMILGVQERAKLAKFPLTISGILDVRVIIKDFASQVRRTQWKQERSLRLGLELDQSDPLRWSQKEIDWFNSIVEKMRLEEFCKGSFENCGYVKFVATPYQENNFQLSTAHGMPGAFE